MEATVKHRIVGSLMLLSLAAIILPFWLDGAGLEQYQSTQQQPPMPEVEVLGVTESRVSQIHTKSVLHLRSRMSAAVLA